MNFFRKSVMILGVVMFAALSAHADEGTVSAFPPDHRRDSSDPKEWSMHFQATSLTQTHSYFHSAYSGQNSLPSAYEMPTTGTATLFIGHKLWDHAFVFVNPEESMGSGLNSTHGIAAFPNGEAFRVDDPKPITNLSRFFIQQEFGFGGGKEKVDDDANKFADEKDVNRLTLVAGKFSLNDYFDQNTYAHDPRTQFFNWALMDIGAWDYAADTRGYTWGLFAEFHQATWSVRAAIAQVPAIANGINLEGDLTHAHAENLEGEYDYKVSEHPGAIRVLAFMNQAHMGNYRDAIRAGAQSATVPDVALTRDYRTKFGFGLNWEQEIHADLGVFARLGWNNGATETWSFTEIDRSLAFGTSLKGTRWKREKDTLGAAFIIDGLSQDHQDYLAAKGVGFIIGDGGLNYSPEELVELYYSYQVFKDLTLTLDLQGVNHPGYNADRGPLAIYGLRAHYEI